MTSRLFIPIFIFSFVSATIFGTAHAAKAKLQSVPPAGQPLFYYEDWLGLLKGWSDTVGRLISESEEISYQPVNHPHRTNPDLNGVDVNEIPHEGGVITLRLPTRRWDRAASWLSGKPRERTMQLVTRESRVPRKFYSEGTVFDAQEIAQPRVPRRLQRIFEKLRRFHDVQFANDKIAHLFTPQVLGVRLLVRPQRTGLTILAHDTTLSFDDPQESTAKPWPLSRVESKIPYANGRYTIAINAMRSSAESPWNFRASGVIRTRQSIRTRIGIADHNYRNFLHQLRGVGH